MQCRCQCAIHTHAQTHMQMVCYFVDVWICVWLVELNCESRNWVDVGHQRQHRRRPPFVQTQLHKLFILSTSFEFFAESPSLKFEPLSSQFTLTTSRYQNAYEKRTDQLTVHSVLTRRMRIYHACDTIIMRLLGVVASKCMVIFEMEWNVMAPCCVCFRTFYIQLFRTSRARLNNGSRKHHTVACPNGNFQIQQQIQQNKRKYVQIVENLNARRLCNVHILSLGNRFMCQTHVVCASAQNVDCVIRMERRTKI